MEIKSEGIILWVVPYGEEGEVASVFTPHGLVSLIRKRRTGKTPLSPLTRCEFIWKEGKGEMGTLKEVSLHNPYLSLRGHLETLESAMECLQAVRQALIGAAPAEPLFRLLDGILQRLAESADPRAFSSLFYLKLLIHEGLLDLDCLDADMASLALARSFSSLLRTTFPREFHDRVQRLFQESIF
jgi:DNA repair protein RecO